jgi:hypothetical protein
MCVFLVIFNVNVRVVICNARVCVVAFVRLCLCVCVFCSHILHVCLCAFVCVCVCLQAYCSKHKLGCKKVYNLDPRVQ